MRDKAHAELVTESRRHPVIKQLESCPGLGEVRAAQIASVVMTPDRFRMRQQFWSYCGLGIVMRLFIRLGADVAGEVGAGRDQADARSQSQSPTRTPTR